MELEQQVDIEAVVYTIKVILIFILELQGLNSQEMVTHANQVVDFDDPTGGWVCWWNRWDSQIDIKCVFFMRTKATRRFFCDHMSDILLTLAIVMRLAGPAIKSDLLTVESQRTKDSFVELVCATSLTCENSLWSIVLPNYSHVLCCHWKHLS